MQHKRTNSSEHPDERMFHPQGPTFWELAQQALSSTERGYDLLAPKFDFTPFRTPDSVLEVVGRVLQAGPPVARAVDICCGTGAAMRMLRPLVGETIVGVDRSRGMLEVAQQKLRDAPGGATLRYVRGEALELPLNQQFDLAVCFGALGHILPRDEPRFVAEIARVLRPGGRFVFVTSEMPPRYSARYLAARAFNAAMHVRNALIRPPFIMFYLTFLLPDAQKLLERHGFDVQIPAVPFPERFRALRLVVAEKRDRDEEMRR